MITRPPESLLTLVCTSTFIVSVVAGCGSDSKTEPGADSGSASDASIPEQTKSSPSLSYHEHAFAQDKNLVATPSTSLVESLSIAVKTLGMAILERTAVTISPSESTTALPSDKSVAMHLNGILNFEKSLIL